MERAAEKLDIRERYDSAPSLERLDPDQAPEPYARVRLSGRFDPRRHILVDNRTHRGRPGVHVLSPFVTSDTGTTLLVNRGWLPLRPDRAALPEVPHHAGELRVSGHLEAIRPPGIRLGQADVLVTDRWPQLATYPDIGQISAALETPLYPEVLYLSEDSPGGFEGRQWAPFPMGPEKHRGYAIQWFALTITACIAWAVLGMMRGRRKTP